MSDATLIQWNSFLNKLVDPSLVDQLGSDLEAAKEFVKSWANSNIKPLVAAETFDAAALRASASDQAAEVSALRQRISTFEPTNATAQNVKRVMEIMADAKDAGIARLEQLANHADGRALSNAERYGTALEMGKQLGAIAGLLDIGMKAGEASSTGLWDPVGEVALGVLTGLVAGIVIGVAFAGTPVLVGLTATITLGYAATKAGEAYLWPLLKDASLRIPDAFWDHLFAATDGIASLVNSLFNSARNWVAPRDPLVLDLDGNGITTSGINPAAPCCSTWTAMAPKPPPAG